MAGRRRYSVFVCHDWEYNQDYYRVRELMSGVEGFRWDDLSVPEHDPLAPDELLEKNLRDQIRPSDVMLVVAGMEAARSEWMHWEMQFARRIGKPIIGVLPWGAVQVPVVVQRHARELVGWNGRSIADAVRRHAPRRRLDG